MGFRRCPALSHYGIGGCLDTAILGLGVEAGSLAHGALISIFVGPRGEGVDNEAAGSEETNGQRASICLCWW